MKKLIMATVMALALACCTEDIDTSARYVFLEKTITEYLESKEYYSEYVRLLGEMPVSIVSQTTYKLSKFNKIVADCINLGYHIFCFNTICNATQERQSEAQEIASDVDAMIVIGGRSSSNTRKLAEICSHECKKTFFIQTAADLIPGCLARCDRIGITAGASTPKHIIEEVQTIVGSEF